MKLEELQPDVSDRGIVPVAIGTVVNVHSSKELPLMKRDPNGRAADEILYHPDQFRLELVERDRPWCFDGDGGLFRVSAEAHGIRPAHLFAPMLAVGALFVEPIPKHINAVFEATLLPLRCVRAKHPGSGKIVLERLLIKQPTEGDDLQPLLDRLSPQSCRTMGGRALASPPSPLRNRHQRQLRVRAREQPVLGE